jgi:hypothetical protein
MTAQDASETLLNAVYTLEPLIRQHADEAESTRRLSPPVVRAGYPLKAGHRYTTMVSGL